MQMDIIHFVSYDTPVSNLMILRTTMRKARQILLNEASSSQYQPGCCWYCTFPPLDSPTCLARGFQCLPHETLLVLVSKVTSLHIKAVFFSKQPSSRFYLDIAYKLSPYGVSGLAPHAAREAVIHTAQRLAAGLLLTWNQEHKAD